MNNTLRAGSKAQGFLSRMLSGGLSVGLLGVILSAPAQAAITVDQQPLILQKPLPPNITLMLDDSGSMAWDFMPDFGYLKNNSNNDALIDATNNGVYYNPSVVYIPPVRADGTSYPNATGLTAAWPDGFHPSSSTVDLTAYDGTAYDTGNVVYSTIVSASSIPVFQYSTGPAAGPYALHYVAATSCGGVSNCVLAADTSGVSAPAGIAAGQNVANWYSYYHTRILMAKSGLMEAFTTIDPTFRVGFGSINGRNDSSLPSPTSTFGGKKIANVVPFGNGSSGTQKYSFWNWLIGEVPNNSTPLRIALDAVGQYYSSAQPWQTSGTDATELACRQSYTILTTDGFWNESFSGPGNVDGTAGPKVTGPNGQSYTYSAVPPYSDSNSNTLADVAMKYWKNDLRTGTANQVPTSTEDPAFWQHMTTFTLGLGFIPVGISPVGTTIAQIFKWANGGAAISGFSWPTPAADSINNIADLAHAAVNGHGGFYAAASPQEFSSGLKDSLKRAAERVGTGASLAANSTQLKTGTAAYQANYYTAKWKGDLKAFNVDPTTGAIATTPTWTAVGALPAAGSRTIFTYNPSAAAGSRAVAFTSTNSTALSAAEQAALGSTAVAQQNLINYLRGSAALEQKNTSGIYRNRDTPLGDVVDSQPVYVAEPDPNQFVGQTFTGSASFAAYSSSNASRTPLIFVAANDGMLHAFNGSTGAETYAYLPGAVITNGLSALANPDYGATTAVPHQYFNDGELTVADVYYASAWHTVAVGTTGRGPAKAVYALDVTDPGNITVLWERSAGDGLTNSNYIGQMIGKPVIAQTADGSWSVLIGNGFNSAAGVSALLQFAIADGALNVHTDTDTTIGNGLDAPAVWIGNLGNGISTTAYAGDARGQMWSFLLNDGTAATPSSTGSLLFTAKDAGGKVQPITGGTLAGMDPMTSDLWLFFGTGQYLASGDLTNLDVQSWYGLIVQSTTSGLVSNLTAGRSALVQRSIVAETAGNPAATPPIAPGRAVTPAPTTADMAGKSGWYIDLRSPLNGVEGERMVTPNLFQGNQLIGTTRIPQAKDVCNPSGRGWIMAINPFTGTGSSSSFFDINGDRVVNASDTITVAGVTYAASGIGFSTLPNNPIFVGNTMLVSFDNGTTGSVATSGSGGPTKRVSWRELINH